MMTSVSGKRGIGKTYHLAKETYLRYKANYFTITNFSHFYANIDCSQEKPETLYDIIRELGVFKERGYELCDLDPRFTHSGVFIAIDEAHLYFSADLFKRYQMEDQFQYILKFLAQARKADIEIWYSTQDPGKIDKNWRRYTEDYIRYVPAVPFWYKKNVLIQRPQRADGSWPLPYYRREVRYPIPLVKEEHHKLDNENPVFDYSMVKKEDGGYTYGPQSTLQSWRFRLSGWLDPFPYKLYDSYQMLAMQGDPEERDFTHLLDFGFMEHTMRYERFSKMKRILGRSVSDSVPPTRVIHTGNKLPSPNEMHTQQTALKQPIEFLDDLTFFNKIHKPTLLLRFRAAAPSALAALTPPNLESQEAKSVTGE